MTFPVFPGSNPSGYNLTRSLRFRSSASANLSKTFSTAGDQKTFTISDWLKRGRLAIDATFFASVTDANNFLIIYYQASTDKIIILGYSGGSAVINISTSAVFRDPSAWYHIVIAFDTTQATGSNRVKLYINNTQQAVTFTTTPTQNLNALPSTTRYIGRAETAANYFDGYLTEVNFIDGQALTPSSFGSTNTLTGVWQPIKYTGTYGTNGFYLPFTDNSALTTSSNAGLGKDFSGNGNYWATNNISITSGVTYDSMTDVPTLTSATAANFAVWNPLTNPNGGSKPTITNGNLTYTSPTNAYSYAFSTITIPEGTGKYIFEISFGTTPTNNNYNSIGVCTNAYIQAVAGNAPNVSGGYLAFDNGGFGNGYYNSSSSSGSITLNSGDVIQCLVDRGANTLQFTKNGTLQTGTGSTITIPSTGELYCFTGHYNVTSNINFGQRPFAYTPPTGFVALNTYNLPTSTIVKGNTVMDATTYTGTGASTSITNAGAFKPDLVWIKSRSAATYNILTDSVRGTNKQWFSNDAIAEESRTDRLTSFNSNGFSLGNYNDVNTSAATYVGWQWQAGQGSSSSNTSGTITSTVSVNASAGFSVIGYTGNGTSGATIGHGLGIAPSFIIIKRRLTPPSVPNSIVYHASVGNTGALVLDTTLVTQTSSGFWNNTSPTSSVISLGNDVNVNNSGNTFIAYAWTPIAGYSAFGSYTGNGSADGTFIYLGFKPKFFMIKVTNATNSWIIVDSARNTYNVFGNYLLANTSGAEGSATVLDFLSNGVKMRNTFNGWNASGETFVYAAFASNPFKNSLAF